VQIGTVLFVINVMVIGNTYCEIGLSFYQWEVCSMLSYFHYWSVYRRTSS